MLFTKITNIHLLISLMLTISDGVYRKKITNNNDNNGGSIWIGINRDHLVDIMDVVEEDSPIKNGSPYSTRDLMEPVNKRDPTESSKTDGSKLIPNPSEN